MHASSAFLSNAGIHAGASPYMEGTCESTAQDGYILLKHASSYASAFCQNT